MTTAEFLQLVEESHLLDEEHLTIARGCAEACKDSKSLARELIRQDCLSRWQAEQLLAARTTFFLGKYKLVGKIGAGGMGAVFKAEQSPLRRVVAIKVLSRELLDSPEAVRRFQREIRAVSSLNHPNIVAALDAGCVGKVHFLAMEYVEGKDLRAWLQQYKQLPISWACECIRQAALGLQHAHEQGLIHRDIKPSNLLVTCAAPDDPPSVKILDLGLARFTNTTEKRTELTSTGQVMGTFDYISPEQAENTKNADIRSDVFSLGCTLFELLTGTVPFGGETPTEKLFARAARDAPRARSLRPEVPLLLDDVIARMLCRKVAERFQSPQEVVEALASCNPAVPEAVSPPALDRASSQGSLRGQADTSVNAFLSELSQHAHAETRTHIPATTAQDDTVQLPPTSAESDDKRSKNRYVAALGLGVLVVIALYFLMPIMFAPSPRKSAASKKRPQRTSSNQENGWMDLHVYVDPEADTVNGIWRSAEVGVFAEVSEFARLQLPYRPPAEYDFLIEFTSVSSQTGDDGRGEVAQIFSKDGVSARWAMWCLDFRHFGFVWDGTVFNTDNPTFSQWPTELEKGRRYRSRIEVRDDGVTAFLDDREVGRWRTDYRNLPSGQNTHTLADNRHLGLTAYRSHVVFHRVAVREISGRGTLTRPRGGQ